MSALTADRDTPRRDGVDSAFPVKAGVRIFAGSIVAIDSANGYATKGATSITLKAVGVAQAQIDNTTGADGDVSVPVRRGTWRLANSAGADQITLKDVGTTAYIVDDQTVAKTDGGGTRSVAGTVNDVDPVGVWIKF